MSDYIGDVIFCVWMSGGNVDAIDRDRVAQYEHDGVPVEEAAEAVLRIQRPSAVWDPPMCADDADPVRELDR